MSPGRIVTISAAPDPNAAEVDAVHENEWYNQDFDGYRISEHPIYEKRPIRMICVGAGAAGLQVAYVSNLHGQTSVICFLTYTNVRHCV